MRRWPLLLLPLIFPVMLASPPAAWADFASDKAKETYDGKGFNPYRETASELPFEHIDPMTGNLLLTFTDLVLPGNAGFDLRIQRTYNSKIFEELAIKKHIEDSWAGLGWSLHFGRVLNPNSVLPGPVVEMPDGSRHQLYLHQDGNTSHFMSKDFWTFEQHPALGSPPILRLPNGVTYSFGHVGVLTGTATQFRYVTKIEDPFHNQILINYLLVDPQDSSRQVPGDVIDTVQQVLATGETRTVRFGYDGTLTYPDGSVLSSGSLHSMSLDGAPWTWNYVQKLTGSTGSGNLGYTLLTSVQPPEGRPWTFNYDENPASEMPYEITDLTTPNGGRIHYTFLKLVFQLGSAVIYSPAVRQRDVTGVPTGGRWVYGYGRFTPDSPDAAPSALGASGAALDPSAHGGTVAIATASAGAAGPLAVASLSSEPMMNVLDPCGIESLYTFYDITDNDTAWRIGALKRKYVGVKRTGNHIDGALHYERFDWDFSAPVSNLSENGLIGRHTHAPLVKSRTVYRTESDGLRSYQTTYTYDKTDYDSKRANNFSDYGRPTTTAEAGELRRLTTRTYFYPEGDDPSFGNYLVNMLDSETVKVDKDDSESFTKSYGYEPDTGFRNSQTIYGIPTTFTRDDGGNVKTSTDANDHRTTYDYQGGVQSAVHTPEYTIRRQINPDGTVRSETRRVWDGQRLEDSTTTFSYDDLLRVIEKDPPGTNPMRTTYDPAGKFITVTRGPSVTTSTLDGLGRVTGTSNTVGVRTTIRYDACGRRAFQSYPFTGTSQPGTTYVRDALGRVKTLTNGDGTTVTFDYRNHTPYRATLITDENKHQTTQVWSSFGDPDEARLVALIDPEVNQPWQYAYNVLGHLRVVAPPGVALDSPGGTRRFTYTTKDQLESEFHPELNGETTYTYDDVGNVRTRTDPAFGQTTFGYDRNNRVLSITRGDVYDTEIRYDDSDHRILVRNGHVSSEFAYDLAGRLQSRTDTMNGQAFGSGYGYDDNDNLMQVTYPTGGKVRYTYDSENRILLVTNGSIPFAKWFHYHPSGAPADFTSGNGLLNKFTYYPTNYRLETVDVKRAGVSQLGLGYSYYDGGNVKAITDTRGASWQQAYDYDKIDRLTAASGIWGAGGSFSYDSQGNRKTSSIGGRSLTFAYDGQSRLTGYAGSENFGGFQYDGNGNTLQDNVGSYSYTRRNQIETATVPGTAGDVTTTYRYDGDDLRTMKIGPDAVRYYVHGPGGTLLSEMQQADPFDPSKIESVRDYVYAGTRLVAAIKPAVFSVAPETLVFAAVAGGASPRPQSITLSYTPPKSVTWTAKVSPPVTWLALSPVSGSTPATVTVAVKSAKLTAGTYKTSITFTSAGAVGSPQTVDVLLVVTPTANLSVTPSALSFSMQPGSLTPPGQQLQVAYALGTVSWTASSTAPWLRLAPGSGASPGAIKVTVDGGALTEGTYTDVITVTSEGTPGSPISVPVQLVVEPAAGHACDAEDWYCEPFDALAFGPLAGQGGWVLGSRDRTSLQVALDPRGPGNALSIDAPAGTTSNLMRKVPDHPIEGSEVSFQLMTTGTTPDVTEVGKIELFTVPKAGFGATTRTFAAVRFGSQLTLQYGVNVSKVLVDPVEDGRWYAVRVQFRDGQIQAFVDGALKFTTTNPLTPDKPLQAFVITGWDLPGAAWFDLLEARPTAPEPQLVVEPPGIDLFTAGSADTVVFADSFDSVPLDEAKWNTTIATAGSRWCGSVWQDVSVQGCGNTPGVPTPYGQVKAGAGTVSFSAGSSKTPAYVWAGPPSRSSPFPQNGDFSIELRGKYDSTAICGEGVAAIPMANSDPVGDHNPLISNAFFGFWGDTGGVYLTGHNQGTTLPASDRNFHTLRLDYKGGVYTFFVDGVQVGNAVSDPERPNVLWIGHPIALTSPCEWSDFSLDYIRVTVPAGTSKLSERFAIRDSLLSMGPDWQASVDVPWLSLDSNSGTGPSVVTATADPQDMPVGTYTGTITVTAARPNSPQVVRVTLEVNP